MTIQADRLSALRDHLATQELDGFIIPLTDEHMSEYVGAYAQRLQWLTGFEGSAGTAVVLADAAAIFVDGRYTLQVQQQVDGTLYAYQSVPQTSPAAWIKERARPNSRIGYDPWLHSRPWVRSTEKLLEPQGITIVPVAANPVDAIWRDRPAPSPAPVELHPDSLSGKSAAAKRADVSEWLHTQQADGVVLTALDSIAWMFNIRGRDVDRTPVALAFALLFADGTADLFIDGEKLTPEVRAHLGDSVRLHDRAAFAATLGQQESLTIVADPERAVAAIFDLLEQGGATIIEARDPAVLPKAIKNEVEIAGIRAAHIRDGAALCRFLHWMSVAGPAGTETELTASDRLYAFRKETNQLQDLSFDTISGAGPNGAIVHYRASEATSRAIAPPMVYLVDSGGQYRDGTTDVTRTIAIGTPTNEQKRRFTQVLKGHIALARARFPQGTRGSQLDILARQFLWADGVDYAHGTGHGVGSYLSVHEGPQRIATYGGGDEPLREGMILSNEPGYYKTDGFGIRIENLVLVTASPQAGDERDMLAFEDLTRAPIDRDLIDPSLLDGGERAWLNAYHERVYAAIAPLVPEDTRQWLAAACAPI